MRVVILMGIRLRDYFNIGEVTFKDLDEFGNIVGRLVEENKEMNSEEEQLSRIALEAEMGGLGYALFPGGYITPDMTDDPELKKHIEQATESLIYTDQAIDGYKQGI